MRVEKDEDKEWDEEVETTRTNARKRKKKPAPAPSTCRRQTRQSFKRYFQTKTKQESITIDLTGETDTSNSLTKDTRSASDSENDYVSSNQISVSSACCSIGTSHLHVASNKSVVDAHQKPIETNLEDPDSYLNSLSQDPSYHVVENEMAEAQMKLSSLLAMDFPLLMSTKNLTELTNLLSKIQEDPLLPMDQLLKLHKIKEIPLIGKYYLEAKQAVEAEECFANLETNVANLICLDKKCKQSKENAAQVQAEIDSKISAKREIEAQIFQLQSRCATFAENVEFKMMVKNDMLSAQISMLDSRESVMQKVELGKSKKQEWELKKANAAKLVAEILAKYAS